MNKMKVRLHSNDESAAEATNSTIQMLPMGGGKLQRGSDGKIAFDSNGLATVISSNDKFIKFALMNQGYVKEVIEEL